MVLERYGVIFLDIDGVLNDAGTYPAERTPSGFMGVSNKHIRILKSIIDAVPYKVDIVLSSDWRYEWYKDYNKCGRDQKYLVDKLKKFDIEIAAKTIRGTGYYDRPAEIMEYLQNTQGITNYLILDDLGFKFKECGMGDHFVRTISRCGLLHTDLVKAVRVLLNDDLPLFIDTES